MGVCVCVQKGDLIREESVVVTTKRQRGQDLLTRKNVWVGGLADVGVKGCWGEWMLGEWMLG